MSSAGNLIYIWQVRSKILQMFGHPSFTIPSDAMSNGTITISLILIPQEVNIHKTNLDFATRWRHIYIDKCQNQS